MEIKAKSVPMSKGLIAKIFKYTWGGKTINRTLRDCTLSLIPMNGLIIDLGSGMKRGHINAPDSRITYTDYYRITDGMKKLDLENPFAIESESYDTVTCFSVLEHIFNYRNVIRESYRILRPGGQFIGNVPFIIRGHAAPDDYFRFTESAIVKEFEAEGFVNKELYYVGYGIFTAAFSMFAAVGIPRVVRLILSIMVIFPDLLISKITNINTSNYALDYVFVFEKK